MQDTLQQFRQEASHRNNTHPAEVSVNLIVMLVQQSVLNQQHSQEEQGIVAANKLFDSARAGALFLLHPSNIMCLCSSLLIR